MRPGGGDSIRERALGLVSSYVGVEPDRPADVVALRSGSAAVLVSYIEHEPPFLRVYSPMLTKVEQSFELLEAINQINASTNYIRVFWRAGTVFAADELLAVTIDLDELVEVCQTVAAVADHHDTLLQRRFGGSLRFDDID